MDDVQGKPGDLVVTNFNGYQHWSVISDRKCAERKYMLISATRRTGTVTEEPWDQVTQGKSTYVVNQVSRISLAEQLDWARSQVGIWDYGVVTNNCEQFANLAAGFEKKSRQVERGAIGVVGGALAVHKLVDNPKPLHYLLGALVGGAAGVYTAKAPIKLNELEFVFADEVEITI